MVWDYFRECGMSFDDVEEEARRMRMGSLFEVNEDGEVSLDEVKSSYLALLVSAKRGSVRNSL